MEDFLILAGATVGFLALHVIFFPRVEASWSRAFQLSRGLAAGLLTVLGSLAFVDSFSRWREAFLWRHGEEDWLRSALLVVCGHLLADLFWMVWSRYFHGMQLRPDLLLHHLLGLAAYGVSIFLEVGHALAMVAMMTEMMPVTTGLHAWARRRGNDLLKSRLERARLRLLAWFRMPFWGSCFLLLLFAPNAGLRAEDPLLRVAAGVALVCLLVLLALDAHWVRKCRSSSEFY